MKKKCYLVSVLTAGLLLAGCSKELDSTLENGIVEGAVGYVKVAVNLPSISNTTRGLNDQFEDGLPEEYQVNDAIMVFFTGTDESSAKLVKAYNVNLDDWSNSDNEHITTKSVILQEAPFPATGYELYALVILNPNNVVSVSGNGLSVSGYTLLPEDGVTIKDLQTFLTDQEVSNYTEINKEASFLMTNSPLAKVNGSDASPTILRQVNVYETKTAADAVIIPDQIYVERAVAKVTLSGFDYDENDGYSKEVTGDSGSSIFAGDKVYLEGWSLNITNKSTALVRNITGFDTWKTIKGTGDTYYFIGTNNIVDDLYRIYWARDYNYDSEDGGFNIYTNKTADKDIPWNENAEREDFSAPLYCLENTMNVEMAKADNPKITYVVLKTKYEIDAEGGAQDFFVLQNNPKEGTLVLSDLLAKVNELCSLSLTSINPNAKGGTKDTVDEIIDLFGNSSINEAQAQLILSELGPINYYKDGDCYYYTSYIEHFGDDYAKNPRDTNAGATSTSGLGYYGVVRNNWYNINIQEINGPGEPEIVPPTDNGFIKTQINILSWAKRTQDEVL